VMKMRKDGTYALMALPDEERGRGGKRKCSAKTRRRSRCLGEVLSRNSVSRPVSYVHAGRRSLAVSERQTDREASGKTAHWAADVT